MKAVSELPAQAKRSPGMPCGHHGIWNKRENRSGNHVVNEALENVIEANVLLSGIGFENNATAGAHSVADGLTALPEGAKTMHGEKVAFGTLCQLVMENRDPEMIDGIYRFCASVGTAHNLKKDLAVEANRQNITASAENSMHSCWQNEPFKVTEEMVETAIIMADALGKTLL